MSIEITQLVFDISRARTYSEMDITVDWITCEQDSVQRSTGAITIDIETIRCTSPCCQGQGTADDGPKSVSAQVPAGTPLAIEKFIETVAGALSRRGLFDLRCFIRDELLNAIDIDESLVVGAYFTQIAIVDDD